MVFRFHIVEPWVLSSFPLTRHVLKWPLNSIVRWSTQLFGGTATWYEEGERQQERFLGQE